MKSMYQCQSSNVNHYSLLLSHLTVSKGAFEEFKSRWSALMGFNRKHANYYIMPQPTDLFRHIILFAKFNTLTSFNPFRRKY